MRQSVPFELTDPKILDNGAPHRIFDEVLERFSAYGQPNPLGRAVWSLVRHADIRCISADIDAFTSSRGLPYPTEAMRIEVIKDDNGDLPRIYK